MITHLPGNGAIYILFLNVDGTVKGEQKISTLHGGLTGPLVNNDDFGRAVTSLGDLNADGHTDLAVGARGHDGAEASGCIRPADVLVAVNGQEVSQLHFDEVIELLRSLGYGNVLLRFMREPLSAGSP